MIDSIEPFAVIDEGQDNALRGTAGEVACFEDKIKEVDEVVSCGTPTKASHLTRIKVWCDVG